MLVRQAQDLVSLHFLSFRFRVALQWSIDKSKAELATEHGCKLLILGLLLVVRPNAISTLI
jgi:hypothetical protein